MGEHSFFAPDFIAMAHRGFHGPDVTENTMAAFDRAVALGFRYLESDLHLTRDGVVVMAHDPGLARVAGTPESIADLTWAELSTKRLRHGEQIPRLEEVLDAWPEVHLNLDAKVPSVVGPAARVIASRSSQERVCIGSFSHRTVLSARAHLPGSAHSASPREVLRWRSGGRPCSPHAYMVPSRSGPIPLVTPASLARARSHGMSVHVWTVNEASEMRALIELGVDGVMTDRADLLKDVLLSLDRWP